MNTSLHCDTIVKNNEEYFLNKCLEKINYILGDDFKLSWIYNIGELNNKKILNYKFINKSQIKNINKANFINEKIKLLENEQFLEVENIKLSGIGRFIKIKIKLTNDYEEEKKILLEEFENKIKLINNKIEMLNMSNCKNVIN